MLRVIDMREANTDNTSFSVWSTSSDRFLYDDEGNQCWDSIEDLVGHMPKTTVERIRRLLPLPPLVPNTQVSFVQEKADKWVVTTHRGQLRHGKLQRMAAGKWCFVGEHPMYIGVMDTIAIKLRELNAYEKRLTE